MEIELCIFEDCLNVINKFVERNNPSFKTFCIEWHAAMFQCIYAVQTTVYEVVQTTKAILYIAKRLVCGKEELERNATDKNNKRQFLRRIAGIYLMYAIYFKQPTHQYAKVLMSTETWQELLLFIENLPANNITDEVRYMFWKLYKEDGFRFTASDYDLGLESLVDYDDLYDIYNGNKYVYTVGEKLKQKLMVVTETGMAVPRLVALEEKYNNSKKSLLSTDKSAKPLPPTKIFKDIQESLKCINDILEQKDNEDDSITDKCVLNTSEKRKELKRKAAGYTTNDESPDESQSPAETAKFYTAVRKFVTQELPESLSADLENNSTDYED